MSGSFPTLVLLVALAAGACSTDAPVTPSAAGSPARHGGSHAPTPAPTAEVERRLAELRRATAPYHNFRKAVDAGYAAAITPCWESRTGGAMGYHYGDPALLRDGAAVDLLRPETLMYEPGPGGQMRLVGMEYIVFIDEWESVHGEGAAPPTLLGMRFHPHSFLPVYKLHVWLWRDNPRGIFADWNPEVSCRHADQVEYFD